MPLPVDFTPKLKGKQRPFSLLYSEFYKKKTQKYLQSHSMCVKGCQTSQHFTHVIGMGPQIGISVLLFYIYIKIRV